MWRERNDIVEESTVIDQFLEKLSGVKSATKFTRDMNTWRERRRRKGTCITIIIFKSCVMLDCCTQFNMNDFIF